jgi:Arc/MetJ-type ribon-helix-helix transcriptional regulator
MRRITVSLPDALGQALHREADRRHVSVSEVTRAALAQYLGLAESMSRELPVAAVGRSGRHSTARDMEQLLEREWDDVLGHSQSV